jgi:SAM-dependent methyltransferase
MNNSPVPHGTGEQCQALRAVLSTAGFTPEGILDTIGVTDSASIRESDTLLLMRRTRGGSPLETLIRLFLMEMSVDADDLRRAVAPMTVEEWVGIGLVGIAGGSAAARFRLSPWQDMVIASDSPGRLLSAEGHDYVMGIGGSSLTLANLTIRRPCRMTLDLGAGCGFQAFLAARHSEHVVAVDRNPRATKFARFNARLNGLENLECREGDLFGPVEGMTFDLIVSNPPFVISPETRYIYRDSGMAGDEVCRRIARDAPSFLNEGGFCQILCNWAEYAGQDWRERLRGWGEGSGCDVWVMRNQSRDTATYAANWLRHTERLETENLPERFDEWLAYYQRCGIERVGGGVITLRRRSGGRNWFHADDGFETMLGYCGDQVLAGFEARDFLDGVTDDGALLRTAPRLCPDVRLVKQLMPLQGEWATEAYQIHLSRGLAHKGEIDPFVERFLIGCDGARTMESLMEEMAVSLSVEPERIRTAVCGMVRRMVERGVLLPPGEKTQG